MRLSDFCSSQDIDRAIAVTVDSFIGSQKVSCKKALSRAFAKYVSFLLLAYSLVLTLSLGTHCRDPSLNRTVGRALRPKTRF